MSPPPGNGVQPGPSSADFDDFYRSQWRAVLGLAFVLCGNWPAAEELTQDAFSEAWRRWETVAAYDNPGAYARRVVATRAISRARRLTTEARTLLRLRARASEGGAELEPEDAAFWAAVRSLPHRQAQVVALHYLDDRSVHDVAAVLGLTEGAVKTHLHRARQALAARLGGEGGT
ncbi:MAG: RNA polymerase sigma factor [Acidimicrobiia bacterium]